MVCENDDPFVEGLADVVVVDGDVFGARMESSILDEFDRRMIVAVNGERILKDFGGVEFGKKMANPDSVEQAVVYSTLPQEYSTLTFRERFLL